MIIAEAAIVGLACSSPAWISQRLLRPFDERDRRMTDALQVVADMVSADAALAWRRASRFWEEGTRLH
jgi:hypothetical protein